MGTMLSRRPAAEKTIRKDVQDANTDHSKDKSKLGREAFPELSSRSVHVKQYSEYESRSALSVWGLLAS